MSSLSAVEQHYRNVTVGFVQFLFRYNDTYLAERVRLSKARENVRKAHVVAAYYAGKRI